MLTKMKNDSIFFLENKEVNMTLMKWQPFTDLVGMYDRINRMFADELLQDSSKGNLTMNAWNPSTDIIETKEAYLFKIELPGFKREDVAIEFNSDTLSIRGERKQEEDVKKGNCHRIERSYGSFQRSFSLPKNIDAKRIEATLNDGLLVLSVPKREEAQTKAIQIQVK